MFGVCCKTTFLENVLVSGIIEVLKHGGIDIELKARWKCGHIKVLRDIEDIGVVFDDEMIERRHRYIRLCLIESGRRNLVIEEERRKDLGNSWS